MELIQSVTFLIVVTDVSSPSWVVSNEEVVCVRSPGAPVGACLLPEEQEGWSGQAGGLRPKPQTLEQHFKACIKLPLGVPGWLS